ncbi:hypothetical protein IU485_19745 [Nocardia cyriacigeorgica]|uniref:DUF7373 family lipoprotein n=1 Tax=Nocardia cyriacigeorgica TaxID=135487 RepID=UPI0018945A9D|nr:hypothetical protein [Nocardia cyriacigeorgica]MBF6083604.1 hypothetical protein [Nocardia cyriacigeorgica]
MIIGKVDRFRIVKQTAVRAIIVILLAITVAGCGDTLSGRPVPGEIDVRDLDTGNYPTLAVDAHDDPIDAPFYDMAQVAGMRLADFTATADEIDPSIKYNLHYDVSYKLIDTDLDRFGTDLGKIAKSNRFLYAFSTGGSSSPISISRSAGQWPKKHERGASTINTLILQLPDSAAAERTAQQLYDADLAHFKDKNQPVELGKYPNARSHWNPESTFIRSTIARSSYVVVFLISAPTSDLPSLTTLTEKAYDTQLPLLDLLPPISDMEVLSLPWDPDRLVVRAMDPLNSGRPSLNDSALNVGMRGILHSAPDRGTARSSYTAMDAVRFGTAGESIVVRTENYDTARKAVTDKLFPVSTIRTADPVPNIPDSTCAETAEKFGLARFDRFVCMVAYHNFVGIVQSDQLIDVHQRAAAQYSILANGR